MATLQARAMLIGFVGLTAAITYNAIFLQAGTHPAPISVEAEDLEARSEGKKREGGISTGALPRFTQNAARSPRAQTISAIQRRLAEEGYEPGPVDGVFGHMTRAAIMAYQHDNGLSVTGDGLPQLLKTMILGVSLGASDKSASPPVPEETRALVRAVQKSLSGLGYEPGPEDGVWGAATRRAIEKFERDRKLDVKGRISGRLMKALVQATGTSLSVVISG